MMGHEEDNKAKGNPDACIIKKPMNIFAELNHLFLASPIHKTAPNIAQARFSSHVSLKIHADISISCFTIHDQ
ncbi:hypothetical protein [Alicyclobacillus acidocaldarius]|uniref:hypothetical protein n=1 Tax=Alicyclobacillus acidocaldarius TaxID=405212 RepID=UPI00130529F6|nr:hypothetical protein [Alicyclobacillus acidocaldarius]